VKCLQHAQRALERNRRRRKGRGLLRAYDEADTLENVSGGRGIKSVIYWNRVTIFTHQLTDTVAVVKPMSGARNPSARRRLAQAVLRNARKALIVDLRGAAFEVPTPNVDIPMELSEDLERRVFGVYAWDDETSSSMGEIIDALGSSLHEGMAWFFQREANEQSDEFEDEDLDDIEKQKAGRGLPDMEQKVKLVMLLPKGRKEWLPESLCVYSWEDALDRLGRSNVRKPDPGPELVQDWLKKRQRWYLNIRNGQKD